MANNYEEIEAKFLNINIEDIEKKLKENGATKVGEYFQKWVTLDYPDWRLDKEGAWIRLRDEGNGEISLSYKKRLGMASKKSGNNDLGMQEIEVKVNDFEKTKLIFETLGFTIKHYAEKKRIRWTKEETEFDIDTYPELEPYIEIETSSWDKIEKEAKLLGLNFEDKKIFSSNQVYALKNIDVSKLIKISFTEGLVEKSN